MKQLAFILTVGLAVQPSAASGQDDRIDAAIDRFTAETITFRHFIHQNPELGNREFETARRVAEHMRELGLEVQTDIAHTGVVGILRGGSTLR